MNRYIKPFWLVCTTLIATNFPAGEVQVYRVAHIQGISRFGVKERWICFQHFHTRPHEEKSGQAGGKCAACCTENKRK